jgi:C4-dicarboxylate-specific signal transduction histidine kinase
MPIAVLILAMASIAMLIWTNKIHERQRRNIALTSTVMDVRIKSATFHLWLEEALGGEPRVDVQRLLSDLDLVIGLGETILNGGESEYGPLAKLWKHSKRQREAESLKILLTEFKSIALQRIQNPETSGIGTFLDERFDDVFVELQRRASTLEALVKRSQIHNEMESRRLSLGILLTWAVIVIAAAIGLWSKESRRRIAEKELQEANRKLQSQAEELKKHRENLTELVEERTTELTAALRFYKEEITDRKRTDKALQESKDRFQKLSLEFHTLLEAITDPLTLLSADLKVLWANRKTACIIPWDTENETPDLADSYCYRLRDGRSAPCEGCPAVKSFGTGREEVAQLETADGRLWELRAYPVKDGAETVSNVLTVAVDVTEKTAFQAETMRAAHLASIGELAAGVAHEINNPINGIINYAQLLVDECNKTRTNGEVPNRIIKEGERIATIVRSLLSFARERKEEKRPVDIHEILSDALALSRAQLKKDGITLKVDMPLELPRIAAHSQQIQQVFLNLINNARFALNQKYRGSHDGKVFEITGEEAACDGCRQLRISFHDMGTGIPADKINKVIDPFFTTKPRGLGTGLGLSISHGIISDHGGKLLIQSVEGQFTEVQILLPAVEEA